MANPRPNARPNLRLVPGGLTSATQPSTTRTTLPSPAADAADKLTERLAQYQQCPIAESTHKAYMASWAHFAEWCEKEGYPALPATPETVALYLDDHKEVFKVATLQRRIAAISQIHQAHKFESPSLQGTLIRTVMATIRRRYGVPQRRKEAILPEDIREMIDAMPRRQSGPRAGQLTAQALRDRLILLLGYAGGFRRSELVALDVEDIRFTREGMNVLMRRSKTDQVGEGKWKVIDRGTRELEYCPVNALIEWQELSLIQTGPVFVRVDRHGVIRLGERLSDKAVARIIKRLVVTIGQDPDIFGGHSLRAGLVTGATLGNASVADIMEATGHKSEAVLRGYIRRANQRKSGLGAKAGL